MYGLGEIRSAGLISNPQSVPAIQAKSSFAKKTISRRAVNDVGTVCELLEREGFGKTNIVLLMVTQLQTVRMHTCSSRREIVA
jgi:hypothetical protein